MKSKIVSTIKYTLFLGIGVLLMYLAFRNIEFEEMWGNVKKADYTWVGLSLVFSFLAYLSRAYRWGMLVEPLGKQPKLSNLLYALSVGYFANLALPRLGEVTRCTALHEVDKSPLDGLFGTVLTERVIDVICLLILLVMVLVSNAQELVGFFTENVFKSSIEKWKNLSPVSVGIMVAIAVVIVGLIYVYRKRLMKIGIIAKIAGFLQGMSEGLKTVLKVKKRGVFLFHTVFIWGMYYISSYVCFFAIPETSHLGLKAALFILVLGGLGMSAPVQGGIGAYHYIVQKGMVFLGVNVVTDAVTGELISPPGLEYAFIVHSSQVLFMVVLGSLSIIMLNVEKRKLLKAHEQA